MKNFKAILALVLVACLFVTLFAACAKDNTNTDTNTNTNANTNTNTDTSDEEVVTIKAYWFDFNSKAGDHGDRISKAVNALTEANINVKVEFTFMNMGDFSSKLTPAIAGGEQIDVVTASIMNSVSTLHRQGMVMEIGALLQEYAPEALATVGGGVNAYTFDGGVYGLPTHRNLLTSRFIIMNKGVLDELGLAEKADKMTTWAEFEEILAAVKDAKASDGMFPIISNSGSVLAGDAFFYNGSLNGVTYDTLSESASVVYTDQDGHVSVKFKEDVWVENAKMVASWNDKGYIYADSIINTTLSGNDLYNQGLTFSLICASEYGVENSGNYQFPAVAKQISQPMLRTSNLATWGMAVPITSEEPEAACKFLNMLYTNADLMNLLVNGEKGVDYDVVDGQVSRKENAYSSGNFVFGNNLLLTPGMGQGADFNEVVVQKMTEMQNSKYLGFTVNNADLEIYISQLTAVNDQYASAMNGGLYTDELYNEYMGKLETAQVDEYIEKVQAQLDAWLAANK